jgi:hypothetical protein
MATFPLYLYNTLNTPITIRDISLEMLAKDFFEIRSIAEMHSLFWTNCDLEALLTQGRVILAKSMANTPPAQEDSYTAAEAIKTLNGIGEALNVGYVDNHGLGESTVQGAIDSVAKAIKGYDLSFIELSEIDVDHNLGKLPTVRVFGPDSVEYEAEVEYVSKNSLKVRLNKGMSGTIQCT